ncbi:hypothetical protein AB0M45_26030 [Nocardia sp. NPDC051787]|uniref:hypothetical protein n=1 Tax=Nocardia sp. NPDC051787 TaxID=3155415 RepID=UPI003433144B
MAGPLAHGPRDGIHCGGVFGGQDLQRLVRPDLVQQAPPAHRPGGIIETLGRLDAVAAEQDLGVGAAVAAGAVPILDICNPSGS